MKQAQADNAQKTKTDFKTNLKKLFLFIFVIGVILWGLQIIFPEQSQIGRAVMLDYGLEVLLIFPAVLVLMGLADVWLPAEKVKKYLGKESGLKGILLSLFLGTLPTGPLFIAFPIAGEMLRKKASTANVVVFLGAWASLKMPQIGIEIQFLGPEFTFYRVLLTFIAVVCIGFITQKMSGYKIEDNK